MMLAMIVRFTTKGEIHKILYEPVFVVVIICIIVVVFVTKLILSKTVFLANNAA